MEPKIRQLKKDAVAMQLREQLASGRFAVGEKLPPELELCRRLGVARVTLRSALAALESEGLLERRHPGGTFVTGIRRRRRVLIVLDSEITHWMTTFYLLPAVESRCRELNLEIQLATPGQLPEEMAHAENYLGAILLKDRYVGGEYELLRLQSYPFPTVHLYGFARDYAVTGFASVRPDPRRAWFDGLRHLIDSGHRRIAVLIRPWKSSALRNDVSAADLEHFFRANKLEQCVELVREPDAPAAVRLAVRGLMKLASPPTAIYCFSDFFAIDIYAELRQLGVAIPKQVAVMNSFGAHRAVLLQPELSFVDTRHRLGGRTAVDLLLNRAEWENLQPKPCLIIPHCVVANESTNIFYHPQLNRRDAK